MKIFLSAIILFFATALFSQECGLSSVYFNPDRSLLTKETKRNLDSLLATFNPNISYLVELHGNTDYRGTTDHNDSLSKRRIEAVKSYIKEKRSSITFLDLSFGESKAIDEDHRKNRRVDIWFLPTKEYGSIVLQGDLKETVTVPIRRFSDCGYCTSNVKLESVYEDDETEIEGQRLKKLNSRITTDCKTIDISQCDSVEFRIPFEAYHPEKARIARPVIAKGCCPRSFGLKEITEIYDVFTDTAAGEYVIYVPCYRFDCMCLCGGGPRCENYKFDLPTDISQLQTRIIMIHGREKKVYLVRDSIHFEVECPLEDILTSYGLRNGELVFADGNFGSFNRTVVYRKRLPSPYQSQDPYLNRPIISHIQVTLEDKHYFPLRYNDTLIRIKTKRNTGIDSVGYYLEYFDYFTPAEKLSERIYSKHFLRDHYFKIGFFKDGKLYAANSTELKIKYKRRKNLIKIKIKRKDLIAPVPPENIFEIKK